MAQRNQARDCSWGTRPSYVLCREQTWDSVSSLEQHDSMSVGKTRQAQALSSRDFQGKHWKRSSAKAAPTRGGSLHSGSGEDTLDIPMRLPPQRFRRGYPGHSYAAPSTTGPWTAAPSTPPVAEAFVCKTFSFMQCMSGNMYQIWICIWLVFRPLNSCRLEQLPDMPCVKKVYRDK